MSKKLIAIMMVATLVFMGVFAACNKEDDSEILYIDSDKYPFLTDENGERVLDENGEFIVFATDENGKYKKDEQGDRMTVNQPFEPISDKDSVEDYYYKITLPKDWEIDESKRNSFINSKTGDTVYITLYDDNYAYQDAYLSNYETYESLLADEYEKEGIKVTWEEGITIADECMGTVRFALNKGEQTNVLYLFKHSGNMYKILFETKKDMNTAKTETLDFLQYITYKPYSYYPAVTDAKGQKVTDVYLTNGGSDYTTEAETTTATSTTVAESSTTTTVDSSTTITVAE